MLFRQLCLSRHQKTPVTTHYELYRNAWRYDAAPHEEQQIDKQQCKALLKRGGLLVRNTFAFDQPDESHFWYVIKDRFGGFNELNTRDRNKVRHALNRFDYRLISHELLLHKGYKIIRETYDDYCVNDRKMNKHVFAQYIAQRSGYGFEHWGIFLKDTETLVGYGIIHCWNDCGELGATGILTEYKHDASYPYYGLYHLWNQHYLSKRQFRYLSDGARSISEHSHIHDFLEQHFGFRKAYCQLEIHYKWWVKWAVKILYPHRNSIKNPRIKAILNMESMRKGEK